MQREWIRIAQKVTKPVTPTASAILRETSQPWPRLKKVTNTERTEVLGEGKVYAFQSS